MQNLQQLRDWIRKSVTIGGELSGLVAVVEFWVCSYLNVDTSK